ncbi:MAG: hypothetical protein EPN57_11330 [Paraburkholderia sp.]|nr:MAG: hypothetical protein EPN57_11330 [Paraburkholderia sp.]
MFRSSEIVTQLHFSAGKKSRRSLSGGRYNLKHFVTASGSQFAHNAFQRFQHRCGLACIDWTLPARRCRIPHGGPLCWSRCRCPVRVIFFGSFSGLLALTP